MGKSWEEVQELVEGATKKIVILSHRSPDGDSIGSSLGFARFFENQGHQVQVISPDPAPRFLHWLPGFDRLINYEKQPENTEKYIESADIVCCLDFNTPSRMGAMEQAFHKRNAAAYVINIDHHQQPDDFANFQLSDVHSSSTAELVYDFILKIKDKTALDSQIAECLYTGILTDTGSFRFSSTSPRTHRATADLLELGIDNSLIYQRIFDNYSQDRIKLLGYALKDKLHLYPQYHAAIIDLSEDELSNYNFQKGDTEGLVNYPLSIGWVKMSILLTQKDGIVKMSFRSKGDFSVNQMARKHFQGGGHENAAGGMSTLSMEDTLKKIELLFPEYEELLKSSAV